MFLLFFVLALFQLKHFIADYPLQNSYMLGKFKGGWDWVNPLLAHVAVHGVFTTTIMLFTNPSLWWLGLLDASVHFIMDRIKASPNLMGRWKALSADEFKVITERQQELTKQMFAAIQSQTNSWKATVERADYVRFANKKRQENKYFWWALGFDQMVHHLTDLLIVFLLFSA